MRWLFIFALALALALALTATAASAAVHSIDLPAETAALRPSDLPGASMAARACAICHSADYIQYQPPGMSLSQWTDEVTKMQHSYGAPISANEVKAIGAYLAVAYGSAKATDADVLAASAPGVPPAPTASNGIDVKGLLTANNCLACHGIDQKIVGPAYHDVAAKYRGDSEAVAKLKKSILSGSSGKWGPIPMPPNTGVTEVQAAALAAFILKQ